MGAFMALLIIITLCITVYQFYNRWLTHEEDKIEKSTECEHKWKIIKEFENNMYPGTEDVTKNYTYVLQCEHCGDIKTENTNN